MSDCYFATFLYIATAFFQFIGEDDLVRVEYYTIWNKSMERRRVEISMAPSLVIYNCAIGHLILFCWLSEVVQTSIQPLKIKRPMNEDGTENPLRQSG